MRLFLKYLLGMHANPLFKTVANKSIFDYCMNEEIKNDIFKSIELNSLLKIKKYSEKKKFWIKFGKFKFFKVDNFIKMWNKI